MSSKRNAGFTLLEILCAILIFALAIGSVISSRIRATRAIAESQFITQAQSLGEMKMTEMEIKYQDALDKGGVKAALGKDQGTFEAPYEAFSWEVEVKENPNVVSQEQLLQFMTAFGVSAEESQSQFEQSKLLLANLNKALKENMVEMVVKVSWQFPRNSTRTFPLVTHLIPKKPKIQFTQNSDVDRNFSP